DLERRGRHYDVGIKVVPGVLTAGPAYPQSIARLQPKAEMLSEVPGLAVEKSASVIRGARTSKRCKRAAGTRTVETSVVAQTLGLAQEVDQSVRDVEVVGEREQFLPEGVVRSIARS